MEGAGMGEVKAWHIGIIAAAVLAVSLSAYFSFGRSGPRITLARSIVMADVTTGELFEYPLTGRRAVMLPGMHPDTGRMVMLPVEQDDAGRWLVAAYARGLLNDLADEPAAVDSETSEVRANGSRPRRVR
jgi:hypothetical protein